MVAGTPGDQGNGSFGYICHFCDERMDLIAGAKRNFGEFLHDWAGAERQAAVLLKVHARAAMAPLSTLSPLFCCFFSLVPRLLKFGF